MAVISREDAALGACRPDLEAVLEAGGLLLGCRESIGGMTGVAGRAETDIAAGTGLASKGGETGRGPGVGSRGGVAAPTGTMGNSVTSRKPVFFVHCKHGGSSLS